MLVTDTTWLGTRLQKCFYKHVWTILNVIVKVVSGYFTHILTGLTGISIFQLSMAEVKYMMFLVVEYIMYVLM